MPRGPRRVYTDATINVTARGNNKRIIFKKDKDYLYFKRLLLKYKTKYKLKIYHYCLMRNHVHLLVQIDEPKSLARAMQGLQLAYFHYFRRRYGYVGRFWQGRFHSKAIEYERYLLTAGLYIEGNPVRAGLVKTPEEYKWSSYKAYICEEEDNLVDLNPLYLSLRNSDEEKQEEYKETMRAYLSAEVENDPLQPFALQ